MGGGGDSRIPSILRDALYAHSVDVVCRTYSFDPVEGHLQIESWLDEIIPDLVIGESLGALHALRIRNIPCLLVSPALNAPYYFELMSWLSLIPGVSCIFDHVYKPKEGDRQSLHFKFSVLRRYLTHRKNALSPSDGDDCTRSHAFFGTRDHYRRSGVVSVRTWKKYFGNSFSIYEGTHFMEEEHILAMLMPSVLKCLHINK
jgi:hypothetical protein